MIRAIAYLLSDVIAASLVIIWLLSPFVLGLRVWNDSQYIQQLEEQQAELVIQLNN